MEIIDSPEKLTESLRNLNNMEPDEKYPGQRWSDGAAYATIWDQYVAHHNHPNTRAEAEALFRSQQSFVAMLNWRIFVQFNRKFDEFEKALARQHALNASTYQRNKNYRNKMPKVLRNTGDYVVTNRLNISQSELVENLRRYVISPDLLRTYGFPVESAIRKGKIIVYKASTNTDVNEDPIQLERQTKRNKDVIRKQCVRCERPFKITPCGLFYVTLENCVFHWGKLYKVGTSLQYTCCGGSRESVGCTTNSVHVWTGIVPGINGPYGDFVRTKDGQQSDEPKMYALDCEMGYTSRGLSVTKVTMIDFNGQLVYQHFVRPTADIGDYNTRFSGVRARDVSKFRNKNVKTLRQVQRDLLKLIDANTILIGHGLENDLRVLRIHHKTVVDTSIVFPHFNGFPHRQSLKYLVKTYLNRNIQLRGQSHDSLEDTRACLDLMLWKVAIDMKRS